MQNQFSRTQLIFGKVDVAKERILEINPDATVNTYKTFYMPDTKEMFNFADYDYVVDAIDTVTGKIQMVLQAQVKEALSLAGRKDLINVL